MGDESRIPIHARVTEEPYEVGPAGRGGEPGVVPRVAPTRVVRQPRRPSRLAVAVVVATLVAGGVGLVLRDGRGSTESDRDVLPPDQGTAPTAPRRVPAHQAYRRAILDLESAGSFAYRGVVRAAGGNPYLPPGWAGGEVTVEGVAALPSFMSRETAVDAAGGAFETVAASGGAWSRGAPSRGGLAEAPWEQLRSTPAGVAFDGPSPTASWPPTGRNQVGELGLAVALATRLAGERRGDPPDAAGRRVIRATLPADNIGEPWAAADVLLTLDDGGDIARIAVASAPGRPRFEVELDIMGIGVPQAVVPPEVGEAARRRVPLDDLAAAGIEPVELGKVPSGWVLTHASVLDAPCTVLHLGYVDATAAGSTAGSLGLTMPTERCAPVLQTVSVVSRPEPFAIGPFAGTIGEQGTRTTGWLSDGVTAVAFDTDLSAEDVTTLLASLRPFDPEQEPTPVDGIPSS